MACIADSSLSSLSSVYRLSSYFFSLLRVSPPSSQRDSRHFHFNLCDRSRSLCFLILCVILQNALSVTSTSPFVKEPSTPSSPLGISAGILSSVGSVFSHLFVPFGFSVDRPSPDVFSSLSPGTPSMKELEEDARALAPILQRLRQRRFFRLFNVDLNKSCPFWAAEAMCSSAGNCEVCQCNEEDVPMVYKHRPIEQFVNRRSLNGDLNPAPTTTSTSSPWNAGFGLVKDEMKGPKATYVDLLINPPSFTGYMGGSVWDQVYRENCYRLSSPLGKGSMGDVGECQEEDRFFKLVSGLHSNIAALSAEYYYPPLTASEGGGVVIEGGGVRYNMAFFFDKLGAYKERISSLYFTFSVLLRTICEVGDVLQECSCEAGNPTEDLWARSDLLQLLNLTYNSCRPDYVEAPLFNRRAIEVLLQFQNITRILDCIECEKCRLHGKLKMTALQVALRAAASDTFVQSLERNEVTALINALAYFTEAVQIIGRFESRLWWWRVLTALRVVVVVFLLVVATHCIMPLVSSTYSKTTHRMRYGRKGREGNSEGKGGEGNSEGKGGERNSEGKGGEGNSVEADLKGISTKRSNISQNIKGD